MNAVLKEGFVTMTAIREVLAVGPDYAFSVTVNDVNYPVDIGLMTSEALLHVFEYGLQRIVNDKTGGKDKTAEDKAKIAKEMIARLEAEEYVRRASRGESDPVMNWVRNIIREQLLANKASEKAKAYKALKDDADGKRDMLDDIFASQPDDVQAKVYEVAKAAREKHLAEKAAAQKATASIGITI